MIKPQLMVGINVGMHNIQTIIVREETNGYLRLMGEHRDRRVVQKSDGALLITRIRTSIEEALKDAQVSQDDILTIGVATGGQIDINNGLILFSSLCDPSECPFPLREKLQALFHPHHITLINNDDAYGIGEQRIGMGKDSNHLIYVRIGYTIGSSIIINGKLYTGADSLAGAFGHMVVDPQGPLCSCGNRGCLEASVSRKAIEQKLYSLQEGFKTVLKDYLNKEPLDINSAIIAEAIDQEDPLALHIVEKAAEILGIGLANIINFVNPHRVILGGDVIDEIDLFFERATASAKKRSLYTNMRYVSIVRSMLGTTGAAYGAAVFAKQHFDALTLKSELFHS